MSYDKSFEDWIVQNGGEVLDPTSQWELVRYKTPHDGLCVVYQNAKGGIKFNGVTKEHYNLFTNGRPIIIHKRSSIAKVKKSIRQALSERDGACCWYCQIGADETDMTLEHVVGINSGGPNHMNNYALACEPCNRVVGDLPVVEKVIFWARARKSHILGLDIHEDNNHPDYVPWIIPEGSK